MRIAALERLGDKVAIQCYIRLVIILDQDHIVCMGRFEQCRSPRVRHGERRGTLVQGGHIGDVAACKDRIRDDALPVHSQGLTMLGRQAHHVAQIGIAGVLDAEPGVASGKKLHQHGQGLLGTDGDDDFVGAGKYAPLGKDLNAQLFHQIRIIIIDEIACPAGYFLDGGGHPHGFAPIVGGEDCLVKLPIEKGIGIVPPVTRLVEVAEARWCDGKPARPVIGRDGLGLCLRL